MDKNYDLTSYFWLLTICAVGLTCFHRVGGEGAVCVSGVLADGWSRAGMTFWCAAAKRDARTANPHQPAEMYC